MSQEIKVYPECVEDKCVHYCKDITFQNKNTQNIDKLWSRFYKSNSYPEYYLGIAKRVAICKCPNTGEEEWFNGEQLLPIINPEKETIVTIALEVKGKIYKRDFVFIGWVKDTVHEWKMTTGSTLKLNQHFVNGLSAYDKRYLKMKH